MSRAKTNLVPKLNKNAKEKPEDFMKMADGITNWESIQSLSKPKIYMADITITIRERKLIEAESFEEAKQKAREERNEIITDIASNYKFKNGQWLEEETITWDSETNQSYVKRSKPIPLTKEAKDE